MIIGRFRNFSLLSLTTYTHTTIVQVIILAPATKSLVSYLLNWSGFKPMKANARLAQTSARSGLDSSLQI